MNNPKSNVKNSSILDAAKNIHAIHLLNDFSGSPLVFSEAIKDCVANGSNVNLYTATPSGNGFLSNIEGVQMNPIHYKWKASKLLTLLHFILAQLSIFFKILFAAKKDDVVYVNTLLPFVALIAAKLKGAKTVMHVHEVSLKPLRLKRMAVFVTEYFASEVIFVSNYLRTQYNFKKPVSRIVFNKLPESFRNRANSFLLSERSTRNTILMICSLKAYKGIYEFVKLAHVMQDYQFELVLNASQKQVNDWIAENSIPLNCKVFPAQSNTHQFYERAQVVLNLSRPTEWVETFGMTVLEAMAYRSFIIVPTVGGPLELLEAYKFGAAIDGTNYKELRDSITNIFKLTSNK